MAELDGLLDLKCLENELKSAIEADKLYWIQNSAKIRAVTDQKVSSYEEFVDRVAAAHLRPLDPKTDRIKSETHKVVWNPSCSKKKNSAEHEKTSEGMISNEDFTRGSNRLQDKLHLLETPERKYALLRETGANEILRSFKKQIPIETFGEVIEALLAFPVTTPDVLFVVSVLEALTKTERFNLSLQFMSRSEKSRLLVLLDKISKSLPNRHQDLAEENVTEWTVEKLKEKYTVKKKAGNEAPSFSTFSSPRAHE